MAVNQLKNKFLGDDSVESRNLLIEQGGAVRAKDSSGTEQELIKFGASDEILVNGAEVAYKSVTDSLDSRLDTAESDIVDLQNDKVDRAGDNQLSGIHEWKVSYGGGEEDKSAIQATSIDSVYTYAGGLDSQTASMSAGGMQVTDVLSGVTKITSISGSKISLTVDGLPAVPTLDAQVTTKKYVDDEVAAVQSDVDGLDTRLTTAENDIVDLQNEDLTFLKLDGSRPMEANLNMMNGLVHHKIVGLADPTDARDAVNKQYVDAIAEGLHVHAPVKTILVDSLATLTGGSVTYNNGTSGVGATLTLGVALTGHDGYTLLNGDRLIVAGESNQAHNGIYTWATGGTVLTRAVDFDTPSEVAGGDFVFVQEGTQFGNTGWVETETTVAIGTSNIVFLQFSGAGSYTAGDALDLIGGEFNVKFDDSSIGVNGSNQLYVKSLGIATGMLQDDSVDKAKINADVAGDGLGQAIDGALKVNVDDSTIEISTDSLRVKDLGIVEAKLADLSVSTAKIQSDAVDKTKINADVAGNGLGQAVDGALEVNVDGVSLEISSDSLRIKDDGVSAAKINSDVAGTGLQQELSGALAVKLDGSSLSVSASGLKSNIRSQKEVYSVISTLTSGAFFDLAYVAEVDSIVAFVDRVAIHEGASWDFSVSYTGGVGGVTRITFLNALVTPGQSQLSNGDNVFFKYERKIA